MLIIGSVCVELIFIMYIHFVCTCICLFARIHYVLFFSMEQCMYCVNNDFVSNSYFGTNDTFLYLFTVYQCCCCRGKLLVAEVMSRFDKIGNFVRKLTKLGFSIQNKVWWRGTNLHCINEIICRIYTIQ